MKRSVKGVLCAALAWVCCASSTYAAEPSRLFSWSGFYAGGYAGYTWGKTDTVYHDTVGPNGQNDPEHPKGAVFGALAGYNYQFEQRVLGLEGEFGGSTAENSRSAFTTATFNEKAESSWVSRFRGRLGYAQDRILLFVAGGLSITNQKWTGSETGLSIPVVSMTKTFLGGNIGGGFEYAFSNNWTGRLEYIHDWYQSKTFGFIAATGDVWSDRAIRPQTDTVRVSLTYMFGN